jgi:hypothetical protein
MRPNFPLRLVYPVEGEQEIKKRAGLKWAYAGGTSLYFQVGEPDDVDAGSWRDTAASHPLRISIYYLDVGTEPIQIAYSSDGVSETNVETIVTKTNTGKPKWSKPYLLAANARFANDVYEDFEYADFRIVSSGQLFLNAVRVKETTLKAKAQWFAGEVDDSALDGQTITDLHEDKVSGWDILDGQLSADNGNVVLNSVTPKMTLGAATDFLNGAGFFVGKSGGYYSMHVGDPVGQYMSFNGATGQLYYTGVTAGPVASGGTDSNSWIINQDLTDTNVDLVFARTTGGNGIIRWNGSVINVLNTLQENGVTVAKQNRQILAGNGLTGGGDLSADRTIALQTPGTLSAASANNAAGNHTHAITSSSNPGAAAALLATDASGFLTLVQLNTDTLADKSGGNLTIAPTGDVVFNPAGKDLLPNANYDLNFGALSKKYLTLHAAELWVETLVAQNTLATISGRILVLTTNILIADCAPAATTIDVKYNNLSNGDVVYLEASGKIEFMQVTSSASVIGGGYRYAVTRNLDGSGADQWYAGDAVANTGQTGSGFIDLYSARGVKSASESGPTIVGNVRNSATYNDWSPMWAIGNLNGLYGYGATTYGAAFGKYAANLPNITIDATNGLRIRNYTTDMLRFDVNGNGYIAGVLNIDTAGGIFQGTGTFASPTTALKQYNYNGIGVLEGWNGGIKQWAIDTAQAFQSAYDGATPKLTIGKNGLVVNGALSASATLSRGPKGATTAADDATVGTIAWGSTSNALSDNDSGSTASLSTGQVSHYLKLTGFGFNLPSTATVVGILVEAKIAATELGTHIIDNSIKIVKGGVISGTDQKRSASTYWNTSFTWNSWGGSNNLWGTTFTYSDINASNFGVVISATTSAGGTSATAYVDYVRITVFYTDTLVRAPVNMGNQVIANLGHLLWDTDNTYDIGASGATRPRDLFLGRNATIGNTAYVGTSIGLNPTSPPASPGEGEIWYNSTTKTMQLRMATANPSLAGVIYTKTASTTVQNTTAITTLLTTTPVIPSNFLTVGKTIRVRASGYYSTTGTPTLRLRVLLGSVVVAGTGTQTTPSSAAQRGWSLDVMITCRSTGAAGTMFAQGYALIATATNDGQMWDMENTATNTIDTTVNQSIDVDATWSVASTSNTITCTNASVEILN